MSASQHPIALRLESLVGGDTKLLALVMMLPLIDGIFPALILAGALDDPLGAVQIGLLIFGGSATVAVILAEMSGTPREQIKIVLLVGVPLILLAAVQAALAPAIDTVLNEAVFERFAAVVILAIAAKTASATIGEYLPSPAVIVGLGLLASLEPAGAAFIVMDDPALVANATLAAVVGVAFALGVAISGPYLREYMDIDRFRFGSAVALGLLPLSLLGMAFGQAPLAALLVAAVFAIDIPLERDDDSSSQSNSSESAPRFSSPSPSPSPSPSAESAPAVGTGPLFNPGGASSNSSSGLGSSASTDGGQDQSAAESVEDEDSSDDSLEDEDSPFDDDEEERAPWL
ncbi:DUF5794 domain-containing protein [Natronococcus sp. A-GB1]|uniref:DUF5794 domain-containing protein n=1 Tax=Natronococcus sp. A-GB1 TaxID=3037648 RepID=UPI00241E79E8|nr:DUF5794 domain-containing protein [Natronococcus sp. A-GB1]MDG5761692.1 DUF5794 domain-containing protein [Natronococcus sp. A-GB1]